MINNRYEFKVYRVNGEGERYLLEEWYIDDLFIAGLKEGGLDTLVLLRIKSMLEDEAKKHDNKK